MRPAIASVAEIGQHGAKYVVAIRFRSEFFANRIFTHACKAGQMVQYSPSPSEYPSPDTSYHPMSVHRRVCVRVCALYLIREILLKDTLALSGNGTDQDADNVSVWHTFHRCRKELGGGGGASGGGWWLNLNEPSAPKWHQQSLGQPQVALPHDGWQSGATRLDHSMPCPFHSIPSRCFASQCACVIERLRLTHFINWNLFVYLLTTGCRRLSYVVCRRLEAVWRRWYHSYAGRSHCIHMHSPHSHHLAV